MENNFINGDFKTSSIFKRPDKIFYNASLYRAQQNERNYTVRSGKLTRKSTQKRVDFFSISWHMHNIISHVLIIFPVECQDMVKMHNRGHQHEQPVTESLVEILLKIRVLMKLNTLGFIRV